ncbi:GMC family oxidoreductase [Pseudomonas fluorescens]|uniref:GMC family oxidoreductase n=1 Tax=Pseudomonas fluorescens TaxID=294 RepID=UPI001CD1D132|nr:GMC family oxidoreductase [Pseudomonas fluorescens]
MIDTLRNADVLVIGGGSAGCTVAGRLAAAGRQVLLIEAGPDYGPRTSPDWPADLLNARTLPTSHDWGYTGPGGAGQPLALDRCRVIGGCSTHNGTTQNVGWAGDYDRWAAQGCPGWDAASLAPLFESALHRYWARHYRQHEIQPFHQAVLGAATAQGLPLVSDFHQLTGGAGAGCAPVNSSLEGVRLNAAFAYLDPVRDSGQLEVLCDTLVQRISFKDGRAQAVHILHQGVEQRLPAKLIVLCAGTYGSPEILLRSGIGPRDHLAELQIPLTHDLPGVGCNLHDQPTANLEYEGTQALAEALAAFEADRVLMDEQTIIKLRSPFAGSAPYDLHVFPWIERDPSLKHGWRCIFPVGLLRPRSRGSLQLTSSDPRAAAAIDTGFFADPEDLPPMLFGLQWTQELIRSPALANFIGAPLATLPQQQTELTEWVRRNHRHYWHPVGTCRMGPASDPYAVVEHTGKVHGLEGLHVADASVFPEVPRGTTALPCAVVGERIALFLLSGAC